MTVKTMFLVAALVGILYGFASIHPLQENARGADCGTPCHEGNCWKYAYVCVKYPLTTADKHNTIWAMTGAGTLIGNEKLVGDHIQYCTKECLDKTKSRAMQGENYGTTSCNGNKVGTFTNKLRFCGS